MNKNMRFATSYFGNRILRHVRSDMHRLRKQGINLVVHTFSENDLLHYKSTMGEIAAATKDAGLDVWLDPWGVGGIFGGEAFSRVALDRPDLQQVTCDGKRLPACCPNNPEFRKFLVGWIESACRTDADGIIWDEPHFFMDKSANILGCFCEYCKDLGEKMDVPATDARMMSILLFLSWAFKHVAAAGKENVLCLLPEDFQENKWARVMKTTRDNGLTNLGTDPYWVLRGEEPEDCITRFGGKATSLATKLRVKSHIWIQGFNVPSGREVEITRAVLAAGRLSPDVIAIWGFEGCAAMSSVTCERPQKAWRAFLKGTSILRGG